MRFSVPRSLSPSPVRRQRQQPRNKSTFGLLDDSDDSDFSEYDEARSSDDSFCYASESEVPQPPTKPRVKIKTTAEQRHIEDTVAAIRLRTRHNDPYEEWEKQTRRDAFRVARKKQTAIQLQMHDELDQARVQESRRLAALYDRQMEEVQAQLNALKIQQQKEEDKLRQDWKERDTLLWQRIDSVIQLEEDKVRARLEAERKVREQEERKRQEEEMQKRQLEEKKRKEEEDKRKALEDAERERIELEKQNEEAEKQRIQHEKDQADRLATEGEHRKAAGLTTPAEDWQNARSILTVLKTNTMKPIKSVKANKSAWGEQRRKITPKIGQLTNDPRAIREITDFIHDQIIMPPQRHPPMLYTGLLSSLAKILLLQAETEVTAEKKAAVPLAHVAFTLLDRLETFPDIFFAKLVQRCGGWPIPTAVPNADFDGRPWADDAERTKVMGYRRSVQIEEGKTSVVEDIVEYMNRVAGGMRLYFHILKIPPQSRPMHPMFQLPRCWTWFARILGNYPLLETPVAAQLIYTGLNVLGSHALEVWGHQWVKMLELIYKGVTVGFAEGRLIGGPTGVGNSARTRVLTEIESIMRDAR
ncbi:GLE1-like protein-domain-containing protein [Mycena alexandri]|uniref:mRNA export factor GLE1 n=1 Tax=Mycena alexandri TaxID=1745969 RepID=A0AAD6S7U7_9AGAR|nr:GLE1-like protein-domain-containing protein [Mycena alexandri]